MDKLANAVQNVDVEPLEYILDTKSAYRVPAPEGPQIDLVDPYESKKIPTQVMAVKHPGQPAVPVYTTGTWQGVRLVEPVEPSYPCIEGGFTIAPHGERGEIVFESPFETPFMWQGCNSQVMVVPNELGKLPKDFKFEANPEKKRFIYKPHVYLQANGKSEDRYVTTGDRESVHPDCFIRIEDLKRRLVKGMTTLYKDDYEGCLQGNYNSLRVWNGKGKTTPYPKFLNYVYGIDIAKTYNTQLFGGQDTNKFGKIDFSKIFLRFCYLAFVAATDPSPQYCVLTRAWDGDLLVGNKKLNLTIVVNDAGAIPLMKAAMEAVEDNEIKFEFKPDYQVVSRRDFKDGLDLFSCHPAKFYYLYFSKEDKEVLRKAVTTLEDDIRSFPEKEFTKKFPELPIIHPKVTISKVTQNSKVFAAITPRCKSQNAVMNNIGAPTIAKKLWPNLDAKQRFVAEWLHRSAYSFGGLDKGGPNSSQSPENLVFGTHETNTMMIRYEEHIKRAAKYSDDGVTVSTRLMSDSKDWKAPKDNSWLAEKLWYSGAYSINNKHEVAHGSFDLFSTRRPTRFELRLDEEFDNRYLRKLSNNVNSKSKKRQATTMISRT